MTTARRTIRMLAALGVVVALCAPPAGARPDPPLGRIAPTPTAPGQGVEGLAVDATTTYRLDEAAGVVHVRAEISLTNTNPPQTVANGIRYSYFDEFVVGALGPTAAVAAVRGESPLAVTIEEPDTHFEFLRIDLVPDLTYGSPQDIVVTYDLPTQPNGSDSVTRVNDAFATWYVSSVGDDGHADVVIDVPERFELEAVTDAPGSTDVTDGRSITRYDDLDLFDGFFGVSARDDERLVIRTTSVDDDEYEIQAWPGDETWADFAVDTVEDGIPALVAFTGLDVDGSRTITVAESGTPYLYGYGGWFLPDDDLVEIGDQIDVHTMLHELAHLWFHTDLFSSRWVTEGLAELAAHQATSALDEDPVPVPALDASAPGNQPLNTWDDVGPGAVSDVADAYGYDTSFAIMAAIHDAIGAKALRDVVARADERELPLRVDGESIRRRARDWRYFYDLLGTAPGVDMETIDPLFDTYVLSDVDRRLVARRTTAMEEYGSIADATAVPPPRVVRIALADWRFDDADEALVVTGKVVDALGELDDALATVVTTPRAIHDAYTDAESIADLEDLLDRLPDVVDAAERLAATEDRVDSLGPVQQLGVLGRDLDGRGDDARAAFATGDLDEMHAELDRIDDAVDQSTLVVVAEAALLALLVGGGFAVRARRRRGSARELPDGVDGEPGQPADDGPVDPDELQVAPEQQFES